MWPSVRWPAWRERPGAASQPLAGPLLRGAAMGGSDPPLAAAGISDPRTWSVLDWAADAVPHLVYGLVTHTVLAASD